MHVDCAFAAPPSSRDAAAAAVRARPRKDDETLDSDMAVKRDRCAVGVSAAGGLSWVQGLSGKGT